MTCSWRGVCERVERRTNWISLSVQQDVGLVSTTGACSVYSQENEGYACYRADGKQYIGNPVLTNEQTIDHYLERSLQQAMPDRKVEVINAAITSTWTHHSLIYLNQSILKYDPDMGLFLDGFNDYFWYDRGHDQFDSYAYNMPSRSILGPPTLRSLALHRVADASAPAFAQ